MSALSRSLVDLFVIHDERRAILLMALFAAGWFVVEDMLGRALTQPYNLLQIVWFRYLVHIALVALVFRREAFWKTGRRGYQLGRSALMLVMPVSFAAAYYMAGGPSQIWVGFWCAPLMVLGFGWLMLGERPAALHWIATSAACLAAMIASGAKLPSDPMVLLGALGMAASFALYVVMTRSLRTERVGVNLFYTAVVPFVMLTPAIPFVWSTPTLWDGAVMAGIGGFGLVTLYLLDRAAAAAPVAVSAAAIPLLAALSAGAGWVTGSHWVGRRMLAASVGVLGILAALWWQSQGRGALARPNPG